MDCAKDYSEKWKQEHKLGVGGQGTTFKVISKTDPVEGALKILTMQKDMERRARMYREEVALKTLSHPRIPRVLDSNASCYEDLTCKLYLVTDFIPGGTLSENLKSKPDAIGMIKTVLEITSTIQYCHKRGIIHRDLKPDNIILKDSNWSDPIVIDFGISFNSEELDNDSLTPSAQHLGNRFLILPEQKVGSSSKRDLRSDLSCCVGILFYLITDLNPTLPLDENGNKPHQTKVASEKIANLPKKYRHRIRALFDTGFEHHVDRRFQSAEALLHSLEDILTAQEIRPKQGPEAVKSFMETRGYTDLKKMRSILEQIDISSRKAVAEAIRQLGPSEFNFYQSNLDFDMKNLTVTNTLGVGNILHENLICIPKLIGYITGSEVVVEGSEGDLHFELLRTPIEGQIDWNRYENDLAGYLVNGIASKL